MHRAALTPERQLLFGTLPKLADFYLAGGTALALQLGHRQSVDFDLFTDQPLPNQFLSEVENVFSNYSVTPMVNNADELTVRVAETKLTLIHYPFPIMEPLIMLDDVRALGVLELAATKAYTIGRRGSLKDYVDLYAVVSGQSATLEQISELAGRKYGDRFNARLFLEQLVWLEDIEDEPIIFLGSTVTKEEIQQFFTEQVKQFPLEQP